MGRFRRGDLIHRLLERLPEIAPHARHVHLLGADPGILDEAIGHLRDDAVTEATRRQAYEWADAAIEAIRSKRSAPSSR